MGIIRLLSQLLLVCSLLWPGFAQAQVEDTEAQQLLTALADSSFADKKAVVNRIASSGDERARGWLESFASNKLARIESSGQFIIVTDNRGRNWTVQSALTGESLGEFSRRDIDTVRVNNALRGELEDILSVIDLKSPDQSSRLTAARALKGSVDSALAERVPGLIDTEQSEPVRAALTEALAIYRVAEQGDLAAVETLSGSLNSQARAALQQAMRSDDPALVAAATKAMDSIEQKLTLNRAAETLYFGLSMGSVLVLAAIGLAITFGVMGVINMAHGELIMLGAYTTWGMQQLLPGQPGLALILSIPAGFLVAALAGVVIERTVIQYLKGRPLETLLATFGVSLILQQLVRTVVSPLNRTVITPEWMSGSVMINEALSLTLNRLYVIGFALVVFAGLMLIMRKTRLGLEVRAVTQNRAMARSMGIRATRVDILTFALGSGVAGLAGVALSQITNVGPNLGQSYIIDSFMVVVFGGVGNLWGTLLAGLTLGTINQLLEPWVGAVLAKIMVLVMIILFIQKRPRGLFPQKGRAAEG
ncbi:urea ABC transporter permease subunit UrtB [Marinobacter sp. LV10MA510-1]|uniref:urea ABC transporter permease subunit UrtB n=1 Tax=Marinobacter sp. LV10MA510-1 TaxID=1415567 RepID=UPI000BF82DFD|nr:urea ABC transporter permease subunit UrtB [Marinobacter sp. LV10MA510-1]PFG11504.1 amino acid/amide ABC transporter membrane protein 1 (HAAT family) [Marinobacter sp. LV10MA510-1]